MHRGSYSTGYPLYGATPSSASSYIMGNRQGRAGTSSSTSAAGGGGGYGGELATAAHSFVSADDGNVIVDNFKTGLSPVRSSNVSLGTSSGSYAQRHAIASAGVRTGSSSSSTALGSMSGLGTVSRGSGGYTTSNTNPSYGYSYSTSSSSSQQQPTQQRASSSSATTRRPLPVGSSVGVGPTMSNADQYGYGGSSASSSGAGASLRRPSSGQFAASSASSSSSGSFYEQGRSSTSATRVPSASAASRLPPASSSSASSSSSSSSGLPSGRTPRLLPQQSEMTVPPPVSMGGMPGTVSRRAAGTGAMAFDPPSSSSTAAPAKRTSSLGIGPGVLDPLPASLTSKAANAAAGIVSVGSMRDVASRTQQQQQQTTSSVNTYSSSTRGNNISTQYYGSRPQQPPSQEQDYYGPSSSSSSRGGGTYSLPPASTGVYGQPNNANSSSSRGSYGIGGRKQYEDDDDDDDGGYGDDDDDDDNDNIYSSSSSAANKRSSAPTVSSAMASGKFLVSSRATAPPPAAAPASSSSSSSSSAAAAAIAQQKAALLARSNQLNQQQPQQQQHHRSAAATSSKYQDEDDDDDDDYDDDDENDRGREYKPNLYVSGTSSRTSGAAATALAKKAAPQPAPYASSPRGLVGLMNLGNTCFMNSCLQCVSNIPPLTDLFIAGSSSSSSSHQLQINRNPATSRTRGEVALAWAELMGRFWGRSSNSSSVESPSRIKKIVGTVASRFLGYDQQDSQEFLVFLLDSLMDDTNTIPGKPPYKELSEKPEQSDSEVANEWWRYYGERCDSRVRDLLTGQLKTVVRCDSCGHISRAFDPFTTLALPIPKSAQVSADECSLGDCLRAFTSPEVLSGSEAHYCSRCKTHRACTKTMTLFRLPPVLILQLKRFTFSTFRRTKLTTSVKFPVTELDMRPFALSGGAGLSSYDLVAVSNHSGSLGGGHYTADALNRDDRNWYHFNDSHVSGTSPRHLSGSAAYLLFYVRRDLL